MSLEDGRLAHGRGRRVGPGEADRVAGDGCGHLCPPGGVGAGGQVRRGLLADLPRKNGWTLAEHAGDRCPDRMQRLLNHAVWDENAASAAVREFVISHLADEFVVVVFDESAQEEKGAFTAGVKGQYAGCVPPSRPLILPTLVAVAGMRWPVEEDSQTGKSHFGLDHSQVRLYPALRPHIILTMIALAACAVTAAAMRDKTATLPPEPSSPHDTPPEDPGLIATTVAEIKRLLNLVTRTWHTASHHPHWAWWRRRHQARARWHHHRARLRRQATAT